MVFFTCNLCGSSLKKNAVAKHSFQCSISQGLSCMDCNKEFWANDYNNHKSCVTENEKYGAAGETSKEPKGKAKQEEWMEMVLSHFKTIKVTNPALKRVLDSISSYDNIPKKEKKFKNFLHSSLTVNNQLINDAWNIVSDVIRKDKKNQTLKKTNNDKHSQNISNGKDAASSKTEYKWSSQNVNSSLGKTKKKKKNKRERELVSSKKRKVNDVNGVETNDVSEVNPTKKKKKSKQEKLVINGETTLNDNENLVNDKNEQNVVEEIGKINMNTKKSENEKNNTSCEQVMEASNAESSEFKWKSAIKRALKETPERRMKFKKLEKIVINDYLSLTGKKDDDEEEHKAKEFFNTKINNDKFVIEDKYIKML